jgi:hypothetical protein
MDSGGVNVDVLRERLKEYSKSLGKHLTQVREEYTQLENRWRSFNSVAAGDYADQFRAGWMRTDAQFKAYIDQSQNIKAFLDERISELDNM